MPEQKDTTKNVAGIFFNYILTAIGSLIFICGSFVWNELRESNKTLNNFEKSLIRNEANVKEFNDFKTETKAKFEKQEKIDERQDQTNINLTNRITELERNRK